MDVRSLVVLNELQSDSGRKFLKKRGKRKERENEWKIKSLLKTKKIVKYLNKTIKIK